MTKATAVSATPRTSDVANLHRIALKIFLDDESVLEPADVIPVFHRWIQTQAVDGLLIDVADYSHMATGPCVVLVAHEGHYVLDRAGGTARAAMRAPATARWRAA